MPFNKGGSPWNKGIPRTDEDKRAISESIKRSYIGRSHPRGMAGKHHSQETKDRISKTNKRLGRKPPATKRIIASKRCPQCRGIFQRRKNNSYFRYQKFCSMRCRGIAKRHQRVCVDCGIRLNGSKRVIRCRACWRGWCIRENAGGWKGGITPENKAARYTKRAKNWRKRVFTRDKYTCRICGIVGGRLQAHHVKRFSTHKKERFLLSNGITLCVSCHKNTDSYGGRK